MSVSLAINGFSFLNINNMLISRSTYCGNQIKIMVKVSAEVIILFVETYFEHF